MPRRGKKKEGNFNRLSTQESWAQVCGEKGKMVIRPQKGGLKKAAL